MCPAETKGRGNPRIVLVGSGRLLLPEGELVYLPGFLSPSASHRFLSELSETVCWMQPRIRMFGREINSPRLSAWYGDPEAVYQYSGLVNRPLPWLPELLTIRRQVEQQAGYGFNGVLLNLYRNGRDSMGWHSDNEKELGESPVVASVSLGTSRRFLLRHRRRSVLPVYELSLENGSLLLMRGVTQKNWRHSVPKTRHPVGRRLNLTFRCIVRNSSSV